MQFCRVYLVHDKLFRYGYDKTMLTESDNTWYISVFIKTLQKKDLKSNENKSKSDFQRIYLYLIIYYAVFIIFVSDIRILSENNTNLLADQRNLIIFLIFCKRKKKAKFNKITSKWYRKLTKSFTIQINNSFWLRRKMIFFFRFLFFPFSISVYQCHQSL